MVEIPLSMAVLRQGSDGSMRSKKTLRGEKKKPKCGELGTTARRASSRPT